MQNQNPGPARAASLRSAAREYEPVQVVVRAGSVPLTGVNVAVTNLTGPGGAVVPNEGINLYREYYVNLPYGSAASTGTNSPLGPGLYPDGLVPFYDPDTHQELSGGAYDAAPFSVAPNQNQPVLVDIFTPAGTPPGRYQGVIAVSWDGGSTTVPLTLDVWNFELPLRRSLHAYTATDPELRDNLANYKELLRHGLNPRWVSLSDEVFLRDTFGLDRVHIDGFNSGSSYRHCYTNNPPPDPSAVAQEAARHAQGLYLYSEYANEVWPCTDNIASGFYLDWARSLRAGGVHPAIVTYPVDTPAPGLLGTAPDYRDSAGDEWSVLPKHYEGALSDIELLRAHGVDFWSYNPLTQDDYSPKFTIDYAPANFRVMQGFINQSIGFVGSKFWRVDYWTADPWNQKNRYDQETGSRAPGEGDMTYRGTEAGLAQDQVIAGMRLKAFREGSDDFEYVQMLKDRGDGEWAMGLVRTVARDFHVWSQDLSALMAVRDQLGDRISGTVVTPTPTVAAPTATPSAIVIPTGTPTTVAPSPTRTLAPTSNPTRTPKPRHTRVPRTRVPDR
jgi:hypothetical protein